MAFPHAPPPAIAPAAEIRVAGVVMPTRFVGIALTTLLAVGVALLPTRGQDRPADRTHTHRDTFAKDTDPAWVKGDANVHFTEKEHDIDAEHARHAGTAERIKIESNPAPGATSAEYVHYYYRTPIAPVSDDLTGTVYVKSLRGGIQLKARVVLPKEKDPKNPDSSLTVLVPGDAYADVQKWKQLSVGNVKKGLTDQLAALTGRLARAIDTTDAYVDHLVLNVYTGPGVSEVWIDDLAIGPVQAADPRADAKKGTAGLAVNPKRAAPGVSFSNGDILIDMHDGKGERAFFMRAVRHSGVPLSVLEQARFNTIWFPGQVSDETYEEAVRAKFFLVPSLPLPQADWDPTRPNQADPAVLEKDADVLAKHFKRFLATDAVLMWDLGSGRTTNQVQRVARLAEAVRAHDPGRPRAVDLWDGYSAYSSYVDAVGGHRWPLFTSLELVGYRDWLTQRRALTAPGKLSWTNIQTHLPEWYQTAVFGKANCERFDAPVGPHPEQIRLLTYLAVASGYRGLTYWSDQFLSDATHGQPRLLEVALLNVEMELLEPLLIGAQDAATWRPTNDPNVLAAVLRSGKDTVVLPVWVGAGSQFVPDQMTNPSLRVVVPLIPEGATAWRISAAGVEEVKDVKRLSEGTQIDLPEFDTTAAVVFTTDLSSRSRVARWQENTRAKFARTAAYWARQQAWAQYTKTAEVHKLICAAGGPDIPDALKLFKQAADQIEEASKLTDNDQPELAYTAARRALRPLRIIAREHWKQATETLDAPSSSPFAVSFYSLPQHWELAKVVRTSRPGGNVLPHGGFELSEDAPRPEKPDPAVKPDPKARPEVVGAAVSSLPGWKVRRATLDAVTPTAAVVNTDRDGVQDPPVPPPPPNPSRYAPGRPVPTDADRALLAPRPTLGRQCLYLRVEGQKGAEPTEALERSFVAVDSPAVDLPPGSLARISFWVKGSVGVSADGLMAFDSAGGEPLGVRVTYSPTWKRWTLYRRVPESGKLSVTFAVTGLGGGYIDDVAIEPLLPATGPSVPARPITALYQLDRTTAPKPLPLNEDLRTLPYPRDRDTSPPKQPPGELLPLPRPGPEARSVPLPTIPIVPR